MDFDKMCALIAERTTLTDYEVEFALAEVMQVIVENIGIGRGTELGPLGSIELAVKANAVDTEEEVNKKLVEKTKIIYKPSNYIKKALKTVKYKMER
jgi:predicted histone-like DNA-binding protein